MLNLPEFEVIKKEVNSHYYRFTIQAIERPFMCTHCCWEELDLPIEDQLRKGNCFDDMYQHRRVSKQNVYHMPKE